HAEEVAPGETYEPERVTGFGVAKVLAQEQPTITDLALDHDLAGDPARVAADVLAELTADQQSRRAVVAYRAGARLTKVVARQPHVATGEIRVREGGTYVLAGGTGYLGPEVARFLARRGAGTVVLLSRTGLPDPERWDEIIDGAEDRSLALRLRTLREV